MQKKWGIWIPSRLEWHDKTFHFYRNADKERNRLIDAEAQCFWDEEEPYPVTRYLDYIVTRTNI